MLVLALVIAIGVLAAIGIFFLFFRKEASDITNAICSLFGQQITALNHITKGCFHGIVNYIKQGEKQKPAIVFPGLISFVVAGISTYANYSVMEKTVQVIFSLELASRWLAIGIVALTALTGMLIHTFNRAPQRAAAIVLAFLLIIVTGSFAYIRANEQESIESMGAESSFSSISDNSMDISDELIFSSSPEASKENSEIQVLKNNGNKIYGGHKPVSEKAVLAAGTAILLATAECLAYYAGFTLAGAALAWILALPVLLMLGIPAIVTSFMIKCNLAEYITTIANNISDSLGKTGEKIKLHATRQGQIILEHFREIARLERLKELIDAQTQVEEKKMEMDNWLKKNITLEQMNAIMLETGLKITSAIYSTILSVYSRVSKSLSAELEKEALANNNGNLKSSAEDVVYRILNENLRAGRFVSREKESNEIFNERSN